MWAEAAKPRKHSCLLTLPRTFFATVIIYKGMVDEAIYGRMRFPRMQCWILIGDGALQNPRRLRHFHWAKLGTVICDGYKLAESLLVVFSDKSNHFLIGIVARESQLLVCTNALEGFGKDVIYLIPGRLVSCACSQWFSDSSRTLSAAGPTQSRRWTRIRFLLCRGISRCTRRIEQPILWVRHSYRRTAMLDRVGRRLICKGVLLVMLPRRNLVGRGRIIGLAGWRRIVGGIWLHRHRRT